MNRSDSSGGLITPSWFLNVEHITVPKEVHSLPKLWQEMREKQLRQWAKHRGISPDLQGVLFISCTSLLFVCFFLHYCLTLTLDICYSKKLINRKRQCFFRRLNALMRQGRTVKRQRNLKKSSRSCRISKPTEWCANCTYDRI